jgi:hypothetical protein
MSSWIRNAKVYAKPKQVVPFYYDISNTMEISRTFLEVLGAAIYSKKQNEKCNIYDPNDFLSIALMYNPNIKVIKTVPENTNKISIKSLQDITATMKFSEIKAAAADIFKYQSLFNQSILNVLKTASIKSTFDMVIHLVTDASGANIPFYLSTIKDYQKKVKKTALNLYIMTDSYANVTAFQAVADPSWKLTSLSKFPPTDAASALFQQLAEVQIFAVAPAAILDFQYALDRFIYVMQRNPKGFDFFKELNGLEDKWKIF